MKQAGVYFTTSESIIFQLMETAKFEKFKEISALMKEKRPDSGIKLIRVILAMYL